MAAAIELLSGQLAQQQHLIEQQQAELESLRRRLDTASGQLNVTGNAWKDQSSAENVEAAHKMDFASDGALLVGLSSSDSEADCPTCPEQLSANDTRKLDIALGGQYRLIYNAANFSFHESIIEDAQDSHTFFNQRFRTWMEVYTNEQVGAYLQVEMGHTLWGAAPEFPKTYGGPFSPAGDRVGVELRRGYLIWKNACGVIRAGIQDWHDAFGESYTLGTSYAVDDYDSQKAVLANSVWDFSVGGISYAGAMPWWPGWNLNAGIFVLWEGDVQAADDAFLLAFDLDRPFNQQHSVGFSVYYVSDHGAYLYPITLPNDQAFTYDSAWEVWLGLRAKTQLVGIPTNTFVIYNTGRREESDGSPDFAHDDVALKLELGPVPVWVGKLSFQTIYATGDSNPNEEDRDGFRTIAQSARDNFGAQGYWSYLILTSPHGPSDVNDLGVSLQNRGLGLFTVQTKYDYPIWGKLSGALAVGWLRSAARNPISGSAEMGTELANLFTLDFGGGLTADFGVSVLFTGAFFKQAPNAPDPDDLYEAYTRVQLEF